MTSARKQLTLVIVIVVMMFATSTVAMATSNDTLVEITFGDISALYTMENSFTTVNITVISYDGDTTASLRFDTTNPRIFQIVNQSSTTIPLSTSEDYPRNYSFVVQGIALGIEELLVVLVKEDGASSAVHSVPMKVRLEPKAIQKVVKYIMMISVFIGFVNMGGTIDLKLIWEKLRRPWGVLIGMLCQFMIMPPLAFGLAKVFQLDAASAIGLVLDGSCPGGHLSNLVSIMLDVDYVLSLTMTSCSNILAMGMMPLNLFIYTPPLIGGNEQLKTPFMEIGIQLVLLFVPISIGMFFKYKYPRISRICQRLLKPLSAILVTLILATSLPFQYFIFDAPRETYIASFLLPLCGAILGSSISKLACLPKLAVITIALETGIQNAILATTIITFFYPQPEADIASRAPYLILLMTVFESIALVIVYTIVKTFILKRLKDDAEAIVDDKGGETNIDDDAKKNGMTVTEMINEGYISDAYDNVVKVKPLEISQKECQTDFENMHV